MAPLFMQHLQPLDTTGKNATWDGQSLWPGVGNITDAIRNISQGLRLEVDMTAAQALFLARYRTWQQSQRVSGVVSLDDVMQVMRAVVRPAAQPLEGASS
jgi:hypothetical protein